MGFEPTIRVNVYTLSKRAPSATRPSLRMRLRSGRERNLLPIHSTAFEKKLTTKDTKKTVLKAVDRMLTG